MEYRTASLLRPTHGTGLPAGQAAVSMPLGWDELGHVFPAEFTISA